MVNKSWHRSHPMPINPTMDQRIAWHVAHARACTCREMPARILAELRKRERHVSERTSKRPTR
jgi:hypothetical protein